MTYMQGKDTRGIRLFIEMNLNSTNSSVVCYLLCCETREAAEEVAGGREKAIDDECYRD